MQRAGNLLRPDFIVISGIGFISNVGGVVSDVIRQSYRGMIDQRLASLFCFAAVTLLCLLSAANAEETRVVIAYSSINPNSSQLEIARAQGFYRKYGLNPEIILVRSSATATAGLASGNI